MHGLKLVIKEEALPLKEQPEFPALAELAKRGLLAPDTWSCKRTQISLKVTLDVPMLGTIIEQNGDGLLEQSHMPVGCPLHIDGAVRQNCAHRGTTLQELDNLLGNTTWRETWSRSIARHPNGLIMQCGIRNTWNPGQASPYTVGELRVSHRTENISSYEVKDSDGLAAVPAATLPDSAFLSALGTPAARMVPLQTGSLAQRATVEVPFWPPCFYWFFGSCFGSHDEAGLLAFEALQGWPRPARGTHGRATVEETAFGVVPTQM